MLLIDPTPANAPAPVAEEATTTPEAPTNGKVADRSLPPRLENEDELVRDAVRSPDAFAKLYRHYLPQIHAFCYRRTGRRDLADDLTAATFERALRNLPKFKPRGGGFGAWLFRIAANQVTDHYRRESRPQSDRGQKAMSLLTTESPSTEDEGIDTLVATDDRDRLRIAIGKLSERHQEAISLRYLAGMDNDDAAQAMSLTRPHMAVVLHRALKALRKVLEDDC